MKTPVELSDQLRAAGLKVTAQRQAIFEILHGNTGHPTAESVHAQVLATQPTISLRTVYQALNDLAAMGEIEQIDLGTGATRFDPNMDPHHHLVCDGCGRVDDLHVAYPDVQVPPDRSPNFEVTRTEIVFRGTCAVCADATPNPQTTRNNKEA